MSFTVEKLDALREEQAKDPKLVIEHAKELWLELGAPGFDWEIRQSPSMPISYEPISEFRCAFEVGYSTLKNEHLRKYVSRAVQKGMVECETSNIAWKLDSNTAVFFNNASSSSDYDFAAQTVLGRHFFDNEEHNNTKLYRMCFGNKKDFLIALWHHIVRNEDSMNSLISLWHKRRDVITKLKKEIIEVLRS